MKKALILLGAVTLFIPAVSFGAFQNNLSYGSQGAEVIELQEFLADQALYSGPITGNFYSLTKSAVKRFQVRESISPASGYFGPLTRTKVNTLLVSSTPIGEDSSTTPATSTPSQIESLLLQIKLLQEQVKSLQQTQTQQIQQQTQILTQIQQNTTPPPIPPAPDKTPPVFTSGPTAIITTYHKSDGAGYLLSSVQWNSNETSFFVSNTCVPGLPGADPNLVLNSVSLFPRTSFECLLTIKDVNENRAQKSYSFSTGPGFLQGWVSTPHPSGLSNGNIVISRFNIFNQENYNLFPNTLIRSFTIKLQKSSNFSVNSISGALYMSNSWSSPYQEFQEISIANFEGETIVEFPAQFTLPFGTQYFMELKANVSSVQPGSSLRTEILDAYTYSQNTDIIKSFSNTPVTISL